MQEDTAVRVGIPIRPTPFHVQFIVAVFLLGVHIAERLAGDEDLTVAYGIDLIAGTEFLSTTKFQLDRSFPLNSFSVFCAFAPLEKQKREAANTAKDSILFFMALNSI